MGAGRDGAAVAGPAVGAAEAMAYSGSRTGPLSVAAGSAEACTGEAGAGDDAAGEGGQDDIDCDWAASAEAVAGARPQSGSGGVPGVVTGMDGGTWAVAGS